MGWFGLVRRVLADKEIDAWADAMRVDGAYQQGYAKGLEHGMASPLDDINRERHRRRLPPLVRQSVSPRQGQSAHQIDGSAGGGTYAAHHSYSVRGFPGGGGGGYHGNPLSPSKETKMAKENSTFVVSDNRFLDWTSGIDCFNEAKRRAVVRAKDRPGETVLVLRVVGSAKVPPPPTIWTDYE